MTVFVVSQKGEVRGATHAAERAGTGKQHEGQPASTGGLWEDIECCSSSSAGVLRRRGRGLGHAPCWTSEAIVSDQDMISKIRARQDMRNEESYTGHAADRCASATREQEVLFRNTHHVNPHPPVL